MGTIAGLEYPEGDPGGLSDAARRLSSLAVRVAGEAAEIRKASRVRGWEGNRFAQFSKAVLGIAPSLENGVGALDRAARSVEDLADQVHRVQRQIRAWAEEIQSAEQEAQAAAVTPQIVPFPAHGTVQDTLIRHSRAIDRLAGLRNRYEPKARQLCEELHRHDLRVSAALLAAAAVAPGGGGGAPDVPADVRLFAPVWIFAPGESYLPADPRRNDRDLKNVDSTEEWKRFLRGQGAGAPIFYRERSLGDEKIIEYWFYRRYNDFRDLGFGAHLNDAEGVAVRFRNGVPEAVGYSQHQGGCSLDYGEATKIGGHPGSYPGDGSGSNSPDPGMANNEVRKLGIDVNPIDELHGERKGEQTPPEHVVHGEEQLVKHQDPRSEWTWRMLTENDYLRHSGQHLRQPLPGGDELADNEDNRPYNDSNSKKFLPDSRVWREECDRLDPHE